MAVDPQPEPQGSAEVWRDPRSEHRAWRAFWSHPMALVGVVGILFLIAFAFLGPLFYRVDPTAQNILMNFKPPSAQHLVGTDGLGRDVLARLMVGGQLSLEVGFSSSIASMIIGVAWGLFSGYMGGWIDNIMMRIVDILISVPVLFYLLFLDAVFRPSPLLLVLIIGAASWFSVSRLVRSEVLSLKSREFVYASRAIGSGPFRIMVKDLFPNVMGTILVSTLFQVVNSILYVATLSFLGLGLPPGSPDWGNMLANSMSYIFENRWWLVYPPGIAILWALLTVNFIGEALRGVFDARLEVGGQP